MRRFLHLLIWSVFFLAGLIDILDLAPSLLNRMALASVGILFLLALRKRNVRLPLWRYVAALVVISGYSGLVIGEQSLFAVLAFLGQLVLRPYLYFVVIVNEADDQVIEGIRKTIVFFVLLQLPAALVKLALVGHTEDIVGTVAFREGSVTVLISLVPAAYLFAKYLAGRRRSDLLLTLAFLLLSQAGGKRATLVYAPVLLAVLVFLHLKQGGFSAARLMRGLTILTAVVALSVYSIVRLNPWLNPEGKVGGRFDPAFVIEFVTFYNTERADDEDVYEFSRTQALPYLWSYLWEQPREVLLFGEGAGRLTAANPDVPPEIEPVTYYYGIRYGARVGVIWLFLQIGVLGAIAFTLLLGRLFLEALRYPWKNHHGLAAVGMLLAITMDIYTYSMVTFRFFSVYGLVFAYCGLLFRARLTDTTHLRDWSAT